MNLWEIIRELRGKSREEQKSLLKDYGVVRELHSHLLSCFDDNGNLLNGLGEIEPPEMVVSFIDTEGGRYFLGQLRPPAEIANMARNTNDPNRYLEDLVDELYRDFHCPEPNDGDFCDWLKEKGWSEVEQDLFLTEVEIG
jgi:hypothetical protein